MSDYKVNLVEEETTSIAEREEAVLEKAGVNTKENDGTYKVDLTKPAVAEEEQIIEDAPVAEDPKVEAIEEQEPVEEEQVLELIKEEPDEVQVQEQEKTSSNEIKEEKSLQEEVEPQVQLPENIQKVVEFMQETGGSLEDYVRLNTDYSSIDNDTLLKEYYKQTKSHLENDEIDFLIEDTFSYDEDMDEERDIRRKKLAYKEEIVKAKSFLEDLKGKYYDEVKLDSKLSTDQKEAVSFYNQYKKEQQELSAQQQKASEMFTKQTENFFNEEFKGFDFKVGENKFRFKVNDSNQVKQVQSNIVDSFKMFLDDNNTLKDPAGYHKALFAARNADKIANHFYEQGRADAIKRLEAESKNINMDPRKTSQGFVDAGGLKVRAVSGDNSSKLRVKIKG